MDGFVSFGGGSCFWGCLDLCERAPASLQGRYLVWYILAARGGENSPAYLIGLVRVLLPVRLMSLQGCVGGLCWDGTWALEVLRWRDLADAHEGAGGEGCYG